ncbi:MAG TPA: hypothetical protein VMV53_09685 [Acidimicrobiales bacterium]|nr:hypothetical protein [Acidimicrobiales bacterium]
MTQPTFLPVPAAGEVRATIPTQTPELARTGKVGLQRSPRSAGGANKGTPAPDAGYALTIAHREVGKLTFEHEHDRHDVEVGIAVLAAKRASIISRGPTLDDVRVALAHCGLGEGVVSHFDAKIFAGLAHSWVAQRHFADAVSDEDLRVDADVVSH